MRLTYILAVTVMATLHASATAFASVKEANAAIEDGAESAIIDRNPSEGGRMLRRVENDEYDLDAFDEERGFGDVVKKLNPVTAVKNSIKHTAKIKQTLKEVAEQQKMLEKAREMVGMN